MMSAMDMIADSGCRGTRIPQAKPITAATSRSKMNVSMSPASTDPACERQAENRKVKKSKLLFDARRCPWLSPSMSATDHIQALIEIRDQLTGDVADLVQLAIDKLMEPIEAEWSARKPTASEIQESNEITNLLGR